MSATSQIDSSALAPQLGKVFQVSPWSVSPGKRIFDLLGASLGLVMAAPIMAISAVVVKLNSSGPVLFRQLRVGRGGKYFELLKFRTMREKPGPAVTRKGDPRVTASGRILRRTKLDELPQLVNVIRGEMSLVGPRPDLPQFWSILQQLQPAIASLRPGVTGQASLAMRDEESCLAAVPESSLEDYYISTLLPLKVEMDLQYAEGSSLFTDVRLLLRTMVKICR
jgi:lipopolysaccharide/colanic/teichoic acid biosynthesis glycosyltransferase